jgi:FkbM family methyltransferase
VAEIVDYDCYSLKLLPEKMDGLILDAGANVGVASLVLAARFKGKVLALEPIKANFRRLQADIAANQGMDIHLVRAALAPADGELRLWQDRGYSVSARQWHGNENLARSGWVEHTVPALSLESLMELAGATHIGLLKIDIEGGEHPWLDSLTLAKVASVRRITMEVHERGSAGGIRTVRRRLRSLGFEFCEKPEMFGRRDLRHVYAWRE